MSTKFKNYFGKHKRLLKLFGVSLSGDEGLLYNIYSVIVIIFLDLTYTSLDLVEIFKHDMNEIGESLAYPFAVTLASAKILLMRRYGKQVGKMMDRLEQAPFRPNRERGGEDEDKIMEECLWITNLQTNVYWTLCGITFAAGATYPMLRHVQNNDYQKLTYGPFTVLNTTYSPNFEITWFYQSLSVLHLAVLFCTVDLVIAGLIAHVTYQFKILQNNFRRLVEISYRKMIKDTKTTDITHNFDKIDGSKIPPQYLQEALAEAIDYHSAIINFANEMENSFSGLLLFVFLGTLLMVGFLTFHASKMSLHDGALLSILGEAAIACMQVLTVCYWGEEMVTQSQQVGSAVWEANFVGTDRRFQKSLVLIIRKGLNPTSMTAKKFVIIRLTTFIWIMRSGYSAFMLMRHNNAENL